MPGYRTSLLREGTGATENRYHVNGQEHRYLASATERAGTTQTSSQATWSILHDYHHNGYAKCPPVLAQFCQHFTGVSGIPVEPVYSGKLFYGLRECLAKGQFAPNSRVLVIHTGGLQGAR